MLARYSRSRRFFVFVVTVVQISSTQEGGKGNSSFNRWSIHRHISIEVPEFRRVQYLRLEACGT
jgi:hypothetical protein